MLAFGQWSVYQTYPDRDVCVEVRERNVLGIFRDPKYTVTKLLCDVEGTKPDRYYSIHFRAESDNVRWKVLYIWYDANGTELTKGYIHNHDRFLAPAGSAKLKLEILLCCKGGGRFCLNSLEVEEDCPYSQRNVKICSIAYEMMDKELIPIPFEDNVAFNLREIDAVAHLQPDVIVLTENAYQTNEDISQTGWSTHNRLDDRHVQALCGRAKKYNCYIVCSLRTVDDDGIYHNTAILIDRDGHIQGTSHKTHLTVGEMEQGLEPGEEYKVFDTDFGKVGMLVCWEHFFPEAVRALTLKGAELILVPTHGFRLDRAATRAMENGVYLVTSHVRETDTVILDRDGNVVADAVGTGYAFAQVDLNKPILVRYLSCNSWGEPHTCYLNERRPSTYGILAQPQGDDGNVY